MSSESSLDAAFGESLPLIFPPVAVHLLNALLAPHPSFSAISDYLAMDPVLSGRILHIANSPAAGLAIKAASLEQAARLLGLNEILKLVVSLGLHKRLQPLVPRNPEALYADWRLTVWSAMAAQALAERLDPALGQQAYLAAMLKDLPLFLAFCRRDLPPFLNRQEMALTGSAERLKAEKAFWGKTHPELAGDIAARWGFPEDLAAALLVQHEQEKAETLPPLGRCLALATRWAEILHCLNPDPAELLAFELTLKAMLGLSAEELTELRATCAGRFKAMLEHLGLSQSEARFRLYEHSPEAVRDMYFLASGITSGQTTAGLGLSLQSRLRAFWGLASWDAYLHGKSGGILFRCRSGALAPEIHLAAKDVSSPPDWKIFPFSGADSGFLALPAKEAPEAMPLFAHLLGLRIKSLASGPAGGASLDNLPLCLARLDASGVVLEASRALLDLADLPLLPPQTSLESLLRSRLKIPSATLERLKAQAPGQGLLVPVPGKPGESWYLALAQGADGEGCLFLGRAELAEELRQPATPAYQEALLAAIDEQVCLLTDSGMIFWDFSDQGALAGKNVFSIFRPEESFPAPWEPALLAGLEKPLRIGAAFSPGSSGQDAARPCALTIAPFRESEGKRLLLVIHAPDASPPGGKAPRADLRDSLTGLYSHSRFHLILEQEAAAARKNGSSLGILYCDLNNFQRINAQYGYRTGDALLTRLADCFAAAPESESRFVCRYEGDDFVILVPRANAAL
ncbi:MAG: GGDEF domain-containing protein, partial [Deltaproteobacteria bacterium]|nr:GGDEF domain-containing protein [Deltaproteobacteria bacterium]